MATTVTIRDVAKRAGVGVGTVSRVLNASESVRESTRLRVLTAIDELNFSPSPIARSLSLGKTMAVGIIVPFFTNDSVVKRLQGIVSVLGSSEYDLVLFDVENTENREFFLTNIVRKKMVDAMLILSLLPAERDLQRFLDSGMPAIMIDANHSRLGHVMVDNVEGARQATKHLIGLGHRKIGYISDYPDNPFNPAPVHDRYKGFLQALNEADLSFKRGHYCESELDSRDARRMARKLLLLSDPPTAIFAYSDTQAIGVLEAARDLGLEVPEDLSVVGYDDIEAAEYIQLTTVRQSLFESGVIGAELLLEAMKGAGQVPHGIVLPTELVIRKTTSAPF